MLFVGLKRRPTSKQCRRFSLRANFMTSFTSSRGLPGAVVVIAALAVFGWSVTFPLLDWDDNLNISENRLVNPPSPGGLLVLWARPYAGLYVPATYSLWSAEAVLAARPATDTVPYPLDARVFHLGNVLLHATNAWLVWLLLVRLIGSRWGAAAGALVFALHPLQVESACWVTETKGLLCAAFSFAALVAFDRFAERWGERQAGVDGAQPSRAKLARGYLLALALFLLALLAKPAAAPLPLVAWIVASWPRARRLEAARVPLLDGSERGEITAAMAAGKQCSAGPALLAGDCANEVSSVSSVSPAGSGTQPDGALANRPAILALWLAPWFAVALGFALLTRNVQGAEELVAPTLWWQRPPVAADALAFYLAKLGLPLSLAPDYGRSPRWLLASGWLWITWLLPAGLAALVCVPLIPPAWRKAIPAWRRAGLISLVLLLPVLGLIPFAFQRFSTVADRYAYLAMLGPAIAIAALAVEIRSRAAHLAIAALLMLAALTSAGQSRHWRSNAALFTQALAVNPTSTVALNGLGNVESKRGDWTAALALYHRAVAADPTNASSWLNAGRAELALGRPLPAIKCFERALEFRPDYDKARLPFAAALAAAGRTDDAAAQIEALLARRPDDALAWENLGRIRAFQNRRPEAIAHFQRALEINPRLESARKALAALTSPGAPAP